MGNFRLIPYLYDAFKPTLVSHLIIFDETPLYTEFDDDYFNDNYKNYWLSVGRLGQAFVACILILVCLLIANLVFFLAALCCKNRHDGCATWVKSRLSQFKFNLYIRYYMLVYFDLTFFSVMKIIEGDNSTTMRKMAVLLSYVLFVVSIVMPIFLISIIFRRFAVLKLKEAKKSFNTLLLKIDKGSKWRVINPAYFFARRLLTALLLTLPIENTFIFLQYVFILMSSLILLILSNLVMNVSQMYFGRENIKKTIRESKLKRAEKEALEEAEEQERRLKKKKEEEEFTRLPDEAGVPTVSPRPTMPTTPPKETTPLWLSLTSRVERRARTRRVMMTVSLTALLVDSKLPTLETPREDARRTRTSRMMSLKARCPDRPEARVRRVPMMALPLLPFPSARRPERAQPTLMPILG